MHVQSETRGGEEIGISRQVNLTIDDSIWESDSGYFKTFSELKPSSRVHDSRTDKAGLLTSNTLSDLVTASIRTVNSG